MPKAKITSKKKIKIRKSLNPLRAKLNVLTSEANRRVQELVEKGVPSRALEEARRTMIRFHSEDQMFVSNLPRSKDLKRELGRTMAFLNDYTSLVGGAENEISGLTHGLFGAQYRANGGYGANPAYIDKETAEMVFDIYGRALSAQGGWSRVMAWMKVANAGAIDYDSESLINAIYDMVQNTSYEDIRSEKGITGSKITPEEKVEYLSIKASQLIKTMIDSSKKMTELQSMGLDYGILGDEKSQKLKQALWRRKLDEIERKYMEGL